MACRTITALPTICARVDGVKQDVIPMAVYESGIYIETFYGDCTGERICAEVEKCGDCIGLDVGATTNIDGSTAESTGVITPFPLVTQPGQLNDFITPISLPSDPCLTALDPTTMIRIRICWDCHDLDTGANGTTGAQIIVGPADSSGDAELVGWSATNTTNQNTLGNPNSFMGTLATALDKADRWLDYDIPVGDLLAGTTIMTSAFGSSNAGVTESLRRQRIKLLTDLTQFGCEACDDCNC